MDGLTKRAKEITTVAACHVPISAGWAPSMADGHTLGHGARGGAPLGTKSRLKPDRHFHEGPASRGAHRLVGRDDWWLRLSEVFHLD